MVSQVHAGEGALHKGAQIVDETRQELTGKLNAVQNELGQVASSWVGAGATGFTQLMNRWNEESTKIVKTLDDFSASLTSTQRSFTSRDEEQQAAYAKMQSMLG